MSAIVTAASQVNPPREGNMRLLSVPDKSAKAIGTAPHLRPASKASAPPIALCVRLKAARSTGQMRDALVVAHSHLIRRCDGRLKIDDLAP